MKNQHVVAIAILILVSVWMIIPRDRQSSAEETPAAERTIAAIPEDASPGEDPSEFTVRARRVEPQNYIERIRVRGRTQAFRQVQVRAEQAGRIVSEPVPRGARVNEGDVLCEIAIDNREADLAEAEARLEQAEFEYQASRDLQSRSLQSDVAVAQLRTAVESARAAVSRAELAIKNTRMVAPFSGVVETRTMEVGDLLNIGEVCASILDDDPMLMVGLVPEQQVDRIATGANVTGILLGGRQLSGEVTFLASSADPVSRSYRMEVTVDATPEAVRAGVTTEMLVDAAEFQAHRIPSSALSLDDAGGVGVKLIDRNNEIVFRNVRIVGDDTDQMDPGVWVTGLTGTVTLVTLGQEVVFDGQKVEANFDWAENRR